MMPRRDKFIVIIMGVWLLALVCVQVGIRHGRNLEQAERARDAAWIQEATCR